jgi:hypothetical protein
MRDLQRFVRRLAQAVAERDPSGLRAPLALPDITERIMPYRACRRELGLETVEDYELLLLRLAGEEHRLAQVWPPEAAERCRIELAGPHPDLALIRELRDVTLQLNLAQLSTEPASQPPTVLDEAPVHAAPSTASPREVPMTAPSPATPVDCPHCGAALPRDREVRFCPHCGGNVRTRPCGSCGTVLELSWRHCVMCGQAVGDPSRFA